MAKYPSENLGNFVEVIARGAFKDSIRTKTVFCIASHDSTRPLANTANGSLKFRETPSYLEYTAQLDPSIAWHADILKSVERGDMPGSSFGFTVDESGVEWDYDTEPPTRTIMKATLYEVSPVTFAAYPSSSVAVRQKGNRMDIQDVYSERQSVHKQMQQLVDNGLELAEDREHYDKLEQRFDVLDRQVRAYQRDQKEREERLQRLAEQEFGMGAPANEAIKPMPVNDRIEKPQRREFKSGEIRVFQPGELGEYIQQRRREWNGSVEMRDFTQFLQQGMTKLPYDIISRFEARALQVDVDTSGGYAVAPEQFAQSIIQSLFNSVFVRQWATIVQVPKAQSLGVPALDTDIGDATWTSELKTGSEDSDMDFDKRALYPAPLARRIKVSNTLIRRNPAVGDLVKSRMSYKFAVVEENAFLNGTSVNQPLGVFTAHASGITTARDVSTNNTSTAIKADNLVDVKYSLKPQYRKNAKWIFHRDAVKMIRKLKDGDGQYIWVSGIGADKPDTILGLPYEESEYCPNTFSASQYVGILGDFSYYWIADALDMQIAVLDQLYAETNQTGYIGRKETDGMPVLEEAFARVKLAA